MFDFECTKDLAPLREFLGQDRAIRAIDFGLSIAHAGYNIYVAGITGTGKTSMVKTYIKKLVEERRAGENNYNPDDWCYLYNFTDPDRPQILNLPQGRGKVFRDHTSNLLVRLSEELAKAFTSEEYNTQRKRVTEESQAEQQQLFQEIQEESQRQGFLLEMTSVGPVIAPVIDGKQLSQAEYMALDESLRKEIEEKRTELMKSIQNTFEKVQDLGRQAAEKLQNNDKVIADLTVSRLFNAIMQEYEDSEKISQYLVDLKSYTMDNLDIFKEKAQQGTSLLGIPQNYITQGRDPYLPFQINVFVDNSNTKGPPVIDEPNPIYSNVFGKFERRFLLGGYLTDHTMLKPGALQQSNGGYLLLNATDVLANPGVWLALKRTIKTKEVGIEEPFEALGLISPQGMRPQPMPIDVKVVLIGDATWYHLLSMYDEDFWEIFRVKADFDFEVARNDENMLAFAAFISGCCEECDLHHFDRTGVAKVLEYASRMVADQEKLSSRFSQIKELVTEAEYWSRKDHVEIVSAQHVEKAIVERTFRHDLPDERIREMINQGTIMIDVDGAVVGQVNGLSVYALGDVTFGKPSRITCNTFLGRGGVINIERESQLSGRIHDKGVLILSGYMGWKYAQDTPLSLSASLCFEQSYEGVEGDSASSTELYALLSSLSDIPIAQNIAVTGSVNQKGEIQPIGGVNQKIEGFFRVCQARGLNGKHGVLIPRQNLRNLMLRQEVVDAARQGKFHIYTVGTIDEGMEVLTGVKAGKRKKDGTYSQGSINCRVHDRLKEMAIKLKHFTTPATEEKHNKESK
jgi:predicted ATP-dependent protease